MTTDVVTTTNPNKALWEKGDFTRIAASMERAARRSSVSLGSGKGLRFWTSDVATEPRRCRRRDSARTFGRRHRQQPRRGWQRPARSLGIANCRFQEGDASDLHELEDDQFDLVVSIFGAMFAPRPFDVAKEIARVTRPGGRIVMGNWIPNDPTLVAQILKISIPYSPPPPEGFVSPMMWGVEENVIERFAGADIPEDKISFEKATYTFNLPGPPAELLAEFRTYYGPTMNAFEAAEASGREAELHHELESLFNEQNATGNEAPTSIPATYLRVTVTT